LLRAPWRTLIPSLGILLILALGWTLWSPGKSVRDGQHDLGTNAIWLQHGWLGDDAWFERYDKDPSLFRSSERIQELAKRMDQHGMTTLFPHLCPCDPKGPIAEVDAEQTERFLDAFPESRVLPWIGGVYESHAFPAQELWRKRFIASVLDLLEAHPRLAGVHVNIEPMPSGNPNFLLLLEELKAAMPADKLLSVAAYPPPTRWHPFPEVHWEEAYYREVAKRVDQMAPMMYDTSIQFPKFYQQLMASWSEEVLTWSEGTETFLGLPAYEDHGVGYHHPHVENLENALLGIHAGLTRSSELPPSYAGVAIYSDWVMDEQEWELFRNGFQRKQ